MIRILAEIRIRLIRGLMLASEIRGAVLMAASIKIIFKTSTRLTVLLGCLSIVLFFIVGYLDLKYLKLYQKEAELNTGKYNPHLKDILKKKT